MKTMNTSGLSAHLKRPLYNPTRDSMQYFRVHDKKSLTTDYNYALASKNIFRTIRDKKETVIFITTFDAEKRQKLTECLTLKNILKPTADIYVRAEQFWVYEVQAKPIAQCPPDEES